jgi:hypothetical protein
MATAEIGPCPPLLMFLNHTQLDTNARITLDEGSARRRGLYLHRTTQHTNTRHKHTTIHALSGIRTRDPSNQAAAYLRLKTARPPGSAEVDITYIYLYSHQRIVRMK